MGRELSGHYRYLVETSAHSVTNDREELNSASVVATRLEKLLFA